MVIKKKKKKKKKKKNTSNNKIKRYGGGIWCHRARPEGTGTVQVL
jgi:hypothetical protein